MIGDQIKELRSKLDLTQQEFAEKLGIKRNTVANYETGRNDPIDAVVSLICHTYNVSEVWLRTGEGDMFQPVSIEEELAGIFGTVMSGDMSTRSRMIRAFAKMPEQYYPLLEEAILEYARKLAEEKDK